jgi:hypothetical protein
MAQGDLCYKEKGGDDEQTEIATPIEGRVALPCQGKKFTRRRDP